MQETFTNTTFVHHIYMCTYVHPCPFFRFTNQHPHFLTFTTTHSIFNFEILIWNTIKFYGRHLPLHWLHDKRVRGWVSGLVLCVCVSVWMLEIPQWQQHLVLKSLLRKQDIFIWRNIHTNIFAQRHWKRNVLQTKDFVFTSKILAIKTWANDDWH